jgi:hypothetical protein
LFTSQGTFSIITVHDRSIPYYYLVQAAHIANTLERLAIISFSVTVKIECGDIDGDERDQAQP